jgi:small subunit ribosomal protein S21
MSNFVNFSLDLLRGRCKTQLGPTQVSWEVWFTWLKSGCRTANLSENALRRFKRKVQHEDIIMEVKRHSFHLQPGEERRATEALARKRSRNKARKEQD